MDKTSTTEINASVIKQALKKDKYPKPSATSLEFLKNFARNFRVINGKELVLN